MVIGKFLIAVKSISLQYGHSFNIEINNFHLSLCKQIIPEPASNKTFDKVTELQDWLAPLKKVPMFNYDPVNITELVKLLKQYADEVTDLPKGIVTTVRILKHLSIEPANPVPGYDEKEGPHEMKYHYAVIEIFSADAMPIFRTILQVMGEIVY